MWKVAALVWIVAGATLAGIGLLFLLSIDALSAYEMKLVPVVAAAGFLLAIPLSVGIARKMVSATRP